MNKKTVLLIVLQIMLGNAVAQQALYRHQVIGTREGLNSSKIFALHQDAQKQLWVGTEHGISCYNGYNFINYQYSHQKAQIGRVVAIVSDKRGGLWIGGDKGLFYNSNNTIRQLQLGNKPGYSITSILCDKEGNIWIGCYDGVYKIPHTQTADFYNGVSVSININNKLNFTHRIFCISNDPYDNIYLATGEGLYLIKKNSLAINNIWTNPEPRNYVRSVAALSPDSVYWNLYDSHPMRMLNKRIDSLPHKDFVGRSVFVHNGMAYALTTSGIASIHYNTIQPIISYENISNLVYASLIDVEGNIWLGSWEGLIKFRKNPFSIYQLQHPLNTDAFSFLENSNNEILIGGNRGRIFVFKNNAIVPHAGFPQLFNRAELMTMYQHSDGSYWFGSGYQGISRLKNNKLRTWNGATDELQNNNCEAIQNAGNGKLFASTEKGVTIINPSIENAIEGYYPFATDFAVNPELFGGIEPAPGQWFFYGSQGIYRLHAEKLHTDSIKQFSFTALYVNKIIKDHNGYLWIATLGHGVLKCSYTNNEWKLLKQYNTGNGLPSNDILSVIADKNNNIWLADYMSLTMIRNKPGADAIFHFDEEDGLLNSYYQRIQLAQQKNGRIWGITTMGVFSFHPDSVYRNMLAPHLQVDSLLLSSAKDASQFRLTAKQMKEKSSFKYHQNTLNFYYTAVSLTNPQAIRYAYRIPELDSNWTITDRRSVNFNFLQPGHYTFELKASNNNDVWTNEPYVYYFTIVPPFWKTTWFIILLILASLLLLFALFKRRLKEVRRKAAIRQQLAELEGKALRAQMNPHFIFNCLNAIQECIVSGNIDAAYDYLAMFSRLLRMVLNNSEKEMVSLEVEIEMLQLYLKLESLRFKQNFSYSIDIDESIDSEMTMVPPLLMQPFIENAIWHGLMHKNGEKKLEIQCKEENALLVCSIKDNGIGRKQSAIIKASKLGADNFQSKGMQLSEQRMRMMNLQEHNKYSLKIIDLEDDNGNVIGTQVLLYLPLNN